MLCITFGRFRTFFSLEWFLSDENGRVGGIITVLFKNGIYELCAAFSYDNRISAFR